MDSSQKMRLQELNDKIVMRTAARTSMAIIDLLLKSIRGLLQFLNLDSKRSKVSPVLSASAMANNSKSPRTDAMCLRSQPNLQLNKLALPLESVQAH
jgi:phosphoenolpyruvate carboxylase